ncbi:MAG: hypothetical protein ACRCXB_15060 [Aeromonadaceae bacterium]
MIDLDELERVCNFLMATGRHNKIPNNMVAENVKELITRLRQSEKDAARYRFVKEWNQSYSLNVYRKELWDEVVDKAMWMESQCNKVRD